IRLSSAYTRLRRRSLPACPLAPITNEYIRSTLSDREGFHPGGRLGRIRSSTPSRFTRMPTRTPYDVKHMLSRHTWLSISSFEAVSVFGRGKFDFDTGASAIVLILNLAHRWLT